MAKARVVYQMQVTQIIDHTPEVRELVVRAMQPEQFSFQAGQFVMLHVPAEPKPLLRAYSLASDDRDQQGFRLLFKYVTGGAASQYVWQLKGDEPLQFTGPFGRVFFQQPPTEQIVFLNTGTGIAQHIGYLLSKADQFPQLSYRLLFGVRTENDIYYREPLDRLVQTLPNFRYEYVLSRPSPTWAGKRGYVQDFLGEFNLPQKESTVYLCGNGAMIKDTKKKLAEEYQMPSTRVFAEAFD